MKRPKWLLTLAWVVAVVVVTACVAAWLELRNPGPVHAAPPGFPRQWVVDGSLRPMGYHQYTTLTSSIDLTDGGTYTIPAGAHLALIQAEGANVRWRDFPRALGDTTDPTATVGMIIYAGDSIWYDGRLDWIELIETTTSATLNVVFYGM